MTTLSRVGSILPILAALGSGGRKGARGPSLEDRQRVVRRIQAFRQDARPRGCEKLTRGSRHRVPHGGVDRPPPTLPSVPCRA